MKDSFKDYIFLVIASIHILTTLMLVFSIPIWFFDFSNDLVKTLTVIGVPIFLLGAFLFLFNRHFRKEWIISLMGLIQAPWE